MDLKHRVVFALLMGAITTGLISFGLIAVNVGFDEGFLDVWLRSWAIAYAVVVPTILIFAPKVQGVVDVLVPAAGVTKKKVAFALLMGSLTTGVISFTLIAVNVGLGDAFPRIWVRAWAMSYVAVIPALLFIAPRVQALVTRLLATEAASMKLE